jgi:ribosomal protein L36
MAGKLSVKNNTRTSATIPKTLCKAVSRVARWFVFNPKNPNFGQIWWAFE